MIPRSGGSGNQSEILKRYVFDPPLGVPEHSPIFPFDAYQTISNILPFRLERDSSRMLSPSK